MKDQKPGHVHAYVNGVCRCGKDPYQVEGELRNSHNNWNN